MPSSGFLFRGAGELVDAPLVAAAEEVTREESGDAGLGHFRADQPGAEGDGVAVVVLAGERSGERLRYLRTAAGRIAVGGDSNADPRPADSDAAIGAAVGERLRHQGSISGVVDAFRAVRAEVDDLMPVCPKPVGKLGLHLETRVVGSKGNAHANLLARR